LQQSPYNSGDFAVEYAAGDAGRQASFSSSGGGIRMNRKVMWSRLDAPDHPYGVPPWDNDRPGILASRVVFFFRRKNEVSIFLVGDGDQPRFPIKPDKAQIFRQFRLTPGEKAVRYIP
jgi:hypothetical protein